MAVYIDQCGNYIKLNQAPTRIISLVPSQTELLFDLELDKEVVGITRYCVHPTHWAHEKTIVGGTKNFNFETIERLEPDLIIGNKEENYKEGIEALQQRFPVWVSDIVTLADACNMINAIGKLADRSYKSKAICAQILESFTKVNRYAPQRTLYLIWRKPWMAVAAGTFIDEMMTTIGLKNCLADRARYPELGVEEIKAIDPDLILLSSEPFPFSEKHIAEIHEICPRAKIVLVDGEMFSWYGSRLLKAVDYFNNLQL